MIGNESAPWSPAWARDLAREALGELPCRLAHSLRAGAQARRVARTVPAADAQLLVSAALLHDIGYAAALEQTSFHPLDGAAFLRDLGAPERLSGLVAHHSEAWLLADARGLLPALTGFLHEDGPVADALTFADMTSGPCGAVVAVIERLAGIRARHAHEPRDLWYARSAREPLLQAAVDRVNRRAFGTEPAGAPAARRVPVV